MSSDKKSTEETDTTHQPTNDTITAAASETTTTTSAEPKENKGFFQNFIDTIRKEIRDLSYVEIVTAVGRCKCKCQS